MKLQIRRNVFETNSSSIHAISILKRAKELVIPEKVIFSLGYYGWENRVYKDTMNKASYLFSAIMQVESWNYPGKSVEYLISKSKRIDNICQILLKNNIDYEFVSKNLDDEDETFYGIDHNELSEFINSVCKNEKRLLSYLFSDESFVSTGNDNSDSILVYGACKTHYIYEKGN